MRAFDPELLARVEDAGINASAPREQRWVDGWLVRFSPGKAKRARCVQAVASGRLGIDAKLERCLAIFAAAGLQPYVRITPFSLPEGLDTRLAELGWERLDETRVMVAQIDAASAAGPLAGSDASRFEAADAATFADWIGGMRRSTPGEVHAHVERLAAAPVRLCAFLTTGAAGSPVAGGQVTIEGDIAGLYDIFTAEAARGRGLASALCRHLLRVAASAGARTAYLQVEASNEPALGVYRRLGFADAYAYHYRSPRAA